MDGAGSKEIAKKLNAEGRRTRSGAEWCNTGVYYILSNEVYTGVTIFNAYRYNKPGGEKPHKEIRVENTHPAIVSRDDFERIRAFLRARRPQVNNAKTLNSDYLLSGIAYCATCGAKLIGTNAKGGRFLYYGCQTYLKRGRAACDAGLISKSFLEEQVVTGLRDEVLTDEKLSTLIRLVNEERAKSRRSGREKGAEIDAQIDGLQGRLDRLCEVLETGHVSAADVGPRLKALRDQIAAAEARKAALASEDSAPVKLSDADVKRRVRDLRQLLERGSVVERKAWLRQWLKRVVVDKKADVIAEYLIPLPGQVVPDWKRESRPAGGLSNEVMSGAQIGSPSPTLFKTKTTYFMSFPLEFLMAAKATSKSCPKRSARGFAWRVYGRLAYL
jgi:site-specific DNA recombinase